MTFDLVSLTLLIQSDDYITYSTNLNHDLLLSVGYEYEAFKAFKEFTVLLSLQCERVPYNSGPSFFTIPDVTLLEGALSIDSLTWNF